MVDREKAYQPSPPQRAPGGLLLRAIVLVTLLLGASYAALAQNASDTGSNGTRVNFALTPFKDTLFTAVDGAFRARIDDDGHVWYTTEGGVAHVDPFNNTRELFTRFEGLPSSYSLGLDVSGDNVFVGTDLGLAIIDRNTGKVQTVTPLNSPLPDQIVQDVMVEGTNVWIGTRFFGVAIWDASRPPGDESAWTFKNTSTSANNYAKSIRRIVPEHNAVWVATEGDGAWRFDRASETWNVTLKDDGLPTNDVLSVAQRGNAVWFGTARGLAVREASGAWRNYTTTQGMPDDRVLDVDIIPTANGTLDVFASTRKGLWQLEPETGLNGTRAQSFGILGAYIFDNEFETSKGWVFATNRGVSLRREGNWQYFATGPSTGPTWGPVSYGFTSASVGDGRGHLWFGSARGVSAYRLPSGTGQGYWQNFGEWQNYPGSVVNWIDTEGNVTWIGTNQGTYGFEHETGRWIPKLASGSRNLVYGLDADGGELWIGLFGDGLVAEDLETGIVRTWDFNTVAHPLPDQYITDVRLDSDSAWLGAGVGVIRIDRVTGAIRGTYTETDGIPGDGVVFRVEPEGAIVWVGTKDGGVGKLDVATGKVSRVWNVTQTPNFPAGQVRSMHREGSNLWVGTTEGLARIDLNTNSVRSWNQSNSDLVQNYVNGITSANGILYVATLSGIQRVELATLEFLPLWDGPGVVRGTAGEETTAPTRVTVRIDSPRDRSAVTGVAQIRGTALAFGASVDRVEVRLGAGPWTPATGTESWTLDWDTSGSTPNEPVVIEARAFAGNLTGSALATVTPVAAPVIPLRVEEVSFSDAYANRPLMVAARAEGDDPLSVALHYRPAGTSTFQELKLTRAGSLFTGTIPARNVFEGEMRYYFQAQSGLLTATSGPDAANPATLTVLPPPTLAVAVEAPGLVEAVAGDPASFALNVTNAGTQSATFTLSASGVRASWVSVPPEDLDLAPGETRAVTVRLNVPPAAFADNTTLTFEARDATGVAEPASASVPIRIHAAESPSPSPTPSPPPSGGGGIPAAPVPLVLAVALALALVLGRRRSA